MRRPLNGDSGGSGCVKAACSPRVLLLVLLAYSLPPLVVGDCPTGPQRRSLVRTPQAVSVRCHCEADRPGEWELTCIAEAPAEAAAAPDHHDVRTLSQPSFVVKFFNSNTIEITCDESVPDFKPAMFQGTNICLPAHSHQSNTHRLQRGCRRHVQTFQLSFARSAPQRHFPPNLSRPTPSPRRLGKHVLPDR